MWLNQQDHLVSRYVEREARERAGNEARNILNRYGIVDDRLPHPNASGYGRGVRRVGVRKTKTKTKKKSKTRGHKKGKKKNSKQGKTRRRVRHKKKNFKRGKK